MRVYNYLWVNLFISILQLLIAGIEVSRSHTSGPLARASKRVWLRETGLKLKVRR